MFSIYSKLNIRMNSLSKCVLCVSLLFLLVVPVHAKRLKVGLVLGGGGAKGAAEVGVLKCIQKVGVPIDFVVGTSIGSIVGGLYSAGVSPEKMEQLFMRQDWVSLFTDRDMAHKNDALHYANGCYYVFGFPVYQTDGFAGRDGVLRGDSIVRLLDSMTGYKDYMHFDKLKIPYRCVAVDLETMSEVVLDRGVLAECMRASMSIPIAFNTKMRDGRKLIDGGAVNNLPVDVAKKLGADIIIAVDLDQTARPGTMLSKTPKEDDTNWLGILTESIDVGGVLNMLAGEPKFAKDLQINLGNLINWFTRHPDDKKYRANLQMVDVLITPNLAGFNLASFEQDKIAKMIKMGEKAGEAVLGKLAEVKTRVMMSAMGFQ